MQKMVCKKATIYL